VLFSKKLLRFFIIDFLLFKYFALDIDPETKKFINFLLISGVQGKENIYIPKGGFAAPFWIN
jgi:hypothetical protein